MSLALFITGVAALLATIVALFRVRHPAMLSMVVMMAGWLASELALFLLALQVIVTAILVGFGALDSTLGMIGLVAMILSWIGLLAAQIIAGRALAACSPSRWTTARRRRPAGSGRALRRSGSSLARSTSTRPASTYSGTSPMGRRPPTGSISTGRPIPTQVRVR